MATRYERNAYVVALGMAIIGVCFLVPAIVLLHERQTDPRASATVSECHLNDGGRYSSTVCSGSWVVGGSLLEGGHVIVGSIDGADERDIGTTIDVTLRGDHATSRRVIVPVIFLGFAMLGIVLSIAIALRTRRGV